MTTAVKVINLGLSKIAASRVSSIEPPKSNLERYMADNYPEWRDAELSARRWRFAMEYKALTLDGELLAASTDKPYRYLMPNDCLRPVRRKGDEWEQHGRFLYSNQNTLTVVCVVRKSENEFDPLFVEVLACKIAYESCEYVTQSNQKKEDAERAYDKAVVRAAKVNAFLTGAEAVSDESTSAADASAFSWVTDRY